ncbi:Ubiquinone biosynthesis protein coq9, mitochondrial [Coemansia guatemalensis]|uniref:Ubiquinone biosynthesis protein n=1 Tax=Coemansia guatemalensis TaxID=2761395 RepID=A0A9W8LRS6_9FUNG|nr:Ubiquinone biosynthesis protein coq9, mitochondrial [Coemansia guatemalensis]
MNWRFAQRSAQRLNASRVQLWQAQHAVNRRLLSSAQGPADQIPPNKARLAIMDLALTKVNEFGWSEQALASAATDLGYSPMAHGSSKDTNAGSNSGLSLITHFMDRALDETRIEADDQLHEFDSTTEKLRFLCRVRLRQTRPMLRHWPEAAAILSQPQNVSVAMSKLADLSSQLYYLAGDKSSRLDWYAKRSALAASYLASELYMCEDRSPNFQATWSFLDRRIEDMASAEHTGLKAVAFTNQFSRNLFNILASWGYIHR